jgi:hypothetical protein
MVAELRMTWPWPHSYFRAATALHTSKRTPLITEPTPNQEVRAGELAVRGVAWSGAAPIARVEVSLGSRSWQEARLVNERKRYSWQWWELITPVEEPGSVTVRARATDLAGRTQPEIAEWNPLGDGNNAIQQVEVRIH